MAQAVVTLAAMAAAYLNRGTTPARLFAIGMVATSLGATYWHLQDYTIVVGAAWLFWRDRPPAWQRWWLLVVAVGGELAWPLTPLPSWWAGGVVAFASATTPGGAGQRPAPGNGLIGADRTSVAFGARVSSSRQRAGRLCGASWWLPRAIHLLFRRVDIHPRRAAMDLAHILQPHNEHPVILLHLIYGALLSTVGIRSYLPYMAVLLALHGANVLLLFEVVRRRAGDLVALAAAALLLVLGAGWENLLWAFQISFVGSLACGLGVLLALDGPSTPPA